MVLETGQAQSRLTGQQRESPTGDCHEQPGEHERAAGMARRRLVRHQNKV